MKKIILAISTIFLGFSALFPKAALAHCPLCVAGAGVGLTLSRLLGIDDSITGIWLGAFLGAMSCWATRALGRRNKIFFHPVVDLIIYILVIVSTIWSFYKFNLVVKHGDIFGYDKLTFGMVIGGALFYIQDFVNDAIIKKRQKSFFPYQRIVVGLGVIVLLSVGMYVLINFYI